MVGCRRTGSSCFDSCTHSIRRAREWCAYLATYRSHAWAIRLCALVPTLMTFIGRMPGMMGTRAAEGEARCTGNEVPTSPRKKQSYDSGQVEAKEAQSNRAH